MRGTCRLGTKWFASKEMPVDERTHRAPRGFHDLSSRAGGHHGGEGRSIRSEASAQHLITKAKKGNLANRRAVIAGLSTQVAAVKLVDQIAPQLTGRTSGHVHVERTRLRVGDGAQMAIVEFVDELKPMPKAAKEAK